MKRILAYGDSNTWGQMAYDGRYEEIKQWCNMLEQPNVDRRVVQEGLCARVAGAYETKFPVLNGQTPFEAIFLSALPLDAVIIALGTNDLKSRYKRTAEDIVNDLLWYRDKIEGIKDTMKSDNIKVIYFAPANFTDNKDYFDAEESLRLEVIKLLQEKAENVVVANNLLMSEDGVHYSEEAHSEVAKILDKKLKEHDL
jgi:lysophospholipase L1-like esterase